MVKTVHSHRSVLSHDALQKTSFRNLHLVGGHIACLLLTVVQQRACCLHTVPGFILRGQILIKRTAQRDGYHLLTATDTQHGHLPVLRLADEVQFQDIAVDAYARQVGSGFLAQQYGVDVSSSAEQYAVQQLQRLHQCFTLLIGRYDERHTASLQHAVVVCLRQLAALLAEVARNTDYGH